MGWRDRSRPPWCREGRVDPASGPAHSPTPALRPQGSRSAQRLVAAFKRDGSPRAAGLIVTLYGDAVAPRGGRAWLGSIARLLAPLGVSERLVRTSVYRLVQAGWLRGEAQGRRTDYCLSAEAGEECDRAETRIYARTAPAWDGRLHAAPMMPHRLALILHQLQISCRP